MISHLQGNIIEIQDSELILDVHNVGYTVQMGTNQLQLLQQKKEETISLAIYTLVREDDIRLFGFPDFTYRKCFTVLLKVNGVGPKAAMLILDQLTPIQIAQAVTTQNAAAFTQISGIGTKVAQKLLLELQDKLAFLPQETLTDKTTIKPQTTTLEVLSALQNLGFTKQVAEKALNKVQDNTSDFDTLLRSCLSYLHQLK